MQTIRIDNPEVVDDIKRIAQYLLRDTKGAFKYPYESNKNGSFHNTYPKRVSKFI